MNLKLGFMNVRGLGDFSKRRETFNWMRSKNCQYTFFKRRIGQKAINMIGKLNGALKHCSAVIQAKKQV